MTTICNFAVVIWSILGVSIPTNVSSLWQLVQPGASTTQRMFCSLVPNLAGVTRLNRRVISKKSTVDPGLGSYSIELETNGNGIVLKRRKSSLGYQVVYAPETSTILKLLPRIQKFLQLVPRAKGSIVPLYVNTREEEYYMYTPPNESSYSFVSLDISSQIKLNIWSEAEQSWQTIFAYPVDFCAPTITCGPFTICDGSAQPPCDCMESFSKKSPWHWDFGDQTQGCIKNTPLYCSSHKNTTSSTDTFHPIARVTLPYNSQSVNLATTHSMCEEACLNCAPALLIPMAIPIALSGMENCLLKIAMMALKLILKIFFTSALQPKICQVCQRTKENQMSELVTNAHGVASSYKARSI
ncbi:hypothetical protein VPH35_036736 [Triticum aestivum]